MRQNEHMDAVACIAGSNAACAGGEIEAARQRGPTSIAACIQTQSKCLDASHFLRRSGQTNRLTPHPGPLPIGWGEGESPAVRPRSWRRKSSNGQELAIAQPTAPPDSLSPSEGKG